MEDLLKILLLANLKKNVKTLVTFVDYNFLSCNLTNTIGSLWKTENISGHSCRKIYLAGTMITGML